MSFHTVDGFKLSDDLFCIECKEKFRGASKRCSGCQAKRESEKVKGYALKRRNAKR